MLLLLMNAAGFGQTAERAFSSLQKKRWTKAREQFNKAFDKDSLDASLHYVMALFYFAPENPARELDSAYRYTLSAFSRFSQLPPRDRERLKRFPMDSSALVRLREQIDSAAFERAKQSDQETAYQHFLDHFLFARQRAEATALRNQAAYRAAVSANTFESFAHFLEKYPEAVQAAEAKERYDRLIFEAKTRDRKLSSFTVFLREHPATPYRAEIEKNIFELSTITGEPASLLMYLKNYPSSSMSARARNILFHLLLEQEQPEWPTQLLTDSLLKVKALHEDQYLVPVFEHGLYGFIDNTGKIVLQPSFKTINDQYVCGNINEDVLIADHKLVSRTGTVIYKSDVLDIEELGVGFLLVKTSSCNSVIHKSGFVFSDCVDGAKVLAGKYILLQKENRWALYSIGGRELTGFDWDEISNAGDILILKKATTIRLLTARDILPVAEGRKTNFSRLYEDVKPWPEDRLWVRFGEFQGVLDQHLMEVVPFRQHMLSAAFFGTIAITGDSTTLYFAEGRTENVSKAKAQQPWLAVKTAGEWKIFDIETGGYSPGYDTIRFEGPFLISQKNDSVTIHFDQHARLQLYKSEIRSVTGKDADSFIMIAQRDKNTVYDKRATRLFTTEFESLQYAGDGFFIVSKKEKKGLLNAAGSLVLPVEYDAIGRSGDKTFTLLKNYKFGAYHAAFKKLIKPQYDKNVIVYNAKTLAVFQRGKYGLLNWDGKPVSAFDYNEIKHWTDTVALVRQNRQWSFYNIDSKKIVGENLDETQYIVDSPIYKLAIVRQGTTFGVIDNKRGYVIPLTFSDIVNIGSAEDPLYFTEKHVEEAGISVVIYYNSEAKMIRRQVFEEEDYEKIYCQDN
jgi:hypothetical protein